MEGKKVVSKTEPEITPEMQKAIDLAVANANIAVAVGVTEKLAAMQKKTAEIQEKTLEALKDVAERSVPADSKEALAKQMADFEDPYVRIDDKVGVLTVSTADLDRMDGVPGTVYQDLPGQFTKQGLQKRLAIPVEQFYDPSLNSKYSFEVIDREVYDAMIAQRGGGSGIPNASMIAAMSRRSGGEA